MDNTKKTDERRKFLNYLFKTDYLCGLFSNPYKIVQGLFSSIDLHRDYNSWAPTLPRNHSHFMRLEHHDLIEEKGLRI